VPKKYDSMEDRLIANSFLSEENYYNGTPCWEWTGALNANGYPKIALPWKAGPRKGKVRSALAHRMSLIVFRGRKLTTKSVARHLCNNKICINPMHLIGGSQQSNIRQCVREGRHYTPWRKAA
jgi:hypothetical protein